MNHHTVTREVAGVQMVVRPPVLLSRVEQWKRRRECRIEFGHCWHAEGFTSWFCCLCSADVDGMPPQNCTFCLAEEATA